MKTILYAGLRCLYIIINEEKYIFFIHLDQLYINKYGIVDQIDEDEFKMICFENKIKFDDIINESRRIFKMINNSRDNVRAFKFSRIKGPSYTIEFKIINN